MITVADAKAQMNIDGTADDVELQRYIDAAIAVVERHLHEVVVARTVVERRTVWAPTRRLVLGQFPVLSLTSIQTVDATGSWDVATFDVHAGTGLVTSRDRALHGDLIVTYTAGRTAGSEPVNYKLAALFIVAHLWESQRAAVAGPQGPFGEDDLLRPAGQGYAIPHRALQLLGEPAPMVG